MSYFGEDSNITGNLNIGTLRINSGTITDTSGVVDFGGDNVLTNGNVGIGIATPLTKLEISGDASEYIKVYNQGTAGDRAGLIMCNDSANNLAGGDTPQWGGFIDWKVGNDDLFIGHYRNYVRNEYITLDSSGNVGIGTTNPYTNLTIAGTSSAAVDFNPSSYTHFSTGSDVKGFFVFDNNVGGLPGYRFVIDSSGNVGIGNSSPYTLLDLGTSVSSQKLALYNSNWNTGGGAGFYGFGTGTSRMDFHANTAEGGTPQMVLNSSGYVGIGTTNPLTKLHIGNSANAFQLTIDGATAYPSAGFLIGGWTGNNHANKHTIQSSSNLHIDSADNGDIYMNNYSGRSMNLCVGGGNVGIGITNPTYKLYVNGSAYATGGWSGSDDRLKHNEEPVLNALSTINKLNVKLYDKTYDMLDADYMGDLTDHEHFREVGVIAQDVLEIPELKDFVKIPEDIETQPYGVNYNCIFSVGLKAIQELSVENLEQQTALEKQGKIIDDLLSRIEALENK